MMPKAHSILEAIRRELTAREKALEIDPGVRRIHLTVILGSRTGNPVKTLYNAESETKYGED